MPTPDSGNRRSRMATLALVVALLGAASMLYFHLGLFRPQVRKVAAAKHLAGEYALGDDFYPIWLTLKLRLGGRNDPYDPETTREIQTGLFGRPLEGRLMPIFCSGQLPKCRFPSYGLRGLLCSLF